MIDGKDWHPLSVGEELTEALNGKTVDKCEVNHYRLDFKFTDGSVLCIEYDWIYEWELQDSPRRENTAVDSHNKEGMA